jgi:dGTPase
MTEAYNGEDIERYAGYDVHTSNRTPFERDRARLLHSSALRRLGTKTQVMGAGFDDFVRTRLTHSLEVAQVGRDLAIVLGCDPNVVETACLAHDIGHPPFGHNGEAALNEIAKNIGGFEGNAQTFRLLTRLETKIDQTDGTSAGLNLTRAVLDATCKYPWRQSEIITSSDPNEGRLANFQPPVGNKFGVYEDDLPTYRWMRKSVLERDEAALQKGEKPTKCLEAQVMDLADDISYSTHDIEDAIVSGALGQSSLEFLGDRSSLLQLQDVNRSWYKEAFNDDEIADAIGRLHELGTLDVLFDGSRKSYARLKNMTSQLIGRFASKTCIATIEQYPCEPRIRYNTSLVVPRDIQAEIHVLKLVSAAYVMNPINETQTSSGQRNAIYDLAQSLQNNPQNLDTLFRFEYDEASSDDQRLRIIVDQIACLTDVSAKRIVSSLTSRI